MWFIFTVVCKAAHAVQKNIVEVYLTNDLGFPVENLSMIKMVCTPINIVLSFLFGYLSADRPFTYQFYGLIGLIIASSYSVLVLLGTFPD